jgi:PilZ domain
MTGDMAERRLNPRSEVRVPLEVRPLGQHKGTTQVIESVNLSPRGVYFVSRVAFDVGEPLQIIFRMPEEVSKHPSEEWKCWARVVGAWQLDRQTGDVGINAVFLCYERLSKVPDGERDSVPHLPHDTLRTRNTSDPSRKMMEFERRRAPRVPLRSKVQITTVNTEIDAESIDVSLEGLLARADRTLAPGTRVQVKMLVPLSTNPIVRFGRIAWADGKERMGIQLDPADTTGRPLEEIVLGFADVP